MNDRKYVAISIKHTTYKWKFGKPCTLWGFHRTKDDEPRCFAGYTEYLSKAEIYAPGDFKEKGYGPSIVKPEPVHMSVDFCKKWRDYDTVLVCADEYEGYCKMACLPISAPFDD